MRTFRSEFLIVSLLIFTLFVSGCGDEHSKESLARPRILQVSIVENDIPNQFSVALSWKSGAGEKYFLHRREPGGSGGILDLTPQVDQPTKSFHDHNVIPGNKYVYSLELASDRSSIFLEEVEIEIYKDVEVTGLSSSEPIRSDNRNRFHRLFLRERSILLTGGQDLTWEVDELIVGEGAAIYSFGEHATNRMGSDGTAGGKIFIKARKARGNLAIFGYGEDGGQGLAGNNGADGVTGEKGEPGRSVTNAEFERMQQPERDAEFLRDKNAMLRPRPRNLTDKTKLLLDVKPDTKLDPNSAFATHVCVKAPTDGRSGAPGHRGEDGGKGGRGGDSAAVFVTVEDAEDFDVKVTVAAGIPGAGGVPGRGGKGGEGGLPGDLDAKKICPSAKAGEKGSDGLPGKIGERGDRGAHLPYCVRLGSRQEGDCASYSN